MLTYISYYLEVVSEKRHIKSHKLIKHSFKSHFQHAMQSLYAVKRFILYFKVIWHFS